MRRIAEIDELYQRVSEVLEQRATREWLDLLPEKEMPRGVSHDSVLDRFQIRKNLTGLNP